LYFIKKENRKRWTTCVSAGKAVSVRWRKIDKKKERGSNLGKTPSPGGGKKEKELVEKEFQIRGKGEVELPWGRGGG